MNVKRYFAKTAREALRMLKDELGPDAVVLSNRAANGGVEILALPAGDVASLQRAKSLPINRLASIPVAIVAKKTFWLSALRLSRRRTYTHTGAPAQPSTCS